MLASEVGTAGAPMRSAMSLTLGSGLRCSSVPFHSLKQALPLNMEVTGSAGLTIQ